MADFHDPSGAPLDWSDIRSSISRRMSYHLRGWESAEIEDATQDVLLRVMRFFERSGMPHSLDGLVRVICRRTAVERMRIRARRPAPQPVREDHAVTADEATLRELVDLEEQVAWKALQVREWFRAHQAPCLELADARAAGTAFKELAGRTGVSHVALLQRWSRCMKRLREAIAQGKLPWNRFGGET
ncbi:MAG: hypothetical protein U0704_11850 [Candidatus Eisenbacteria bacterium]